MNKITAKKVSRYLQSTGWTREVNFKRKEIMIFKKQFPSEEVKISLPSNEKFEGFYLEFSQIIGTVSYFESISIDKLMDKIIES
jgi:hypothetical protein